MSGHQDWIGEMLGSDGVQGGCLGLGRREPLPQDGQWPCLAEGWELGWGRPSLRWGRCLPLTAQQIRHLFYPWNAASWSDLWPYYKALPEVWIFLIQFAFWGKLITMLPSPLNWNQSCLLVARALRAAQPGQPSPLSRAVSSSWAPEALRAGDSLAGHLGTRTRGLQCSCPMDKPSPAPRGPWVLT